MTATGAEEAAKFSNRSPLDTWKESPGPFLKFEGPFCLGEGERKKKKRERESSRARDLGNGFESGQAGPV